MELAVQLCSSADDETRLQLLWDGSLEDHIFCADDEENSLFKHD